MAAGREGGITRSHRAREELAKAWLLDVLERTPLAEIEQMPVGWLAREGPSLIDDIVRGLTSASAELELPAEGIERIGELGHLRRGSAALQIPRDLAALQSLLIEALRYEVPERRLGSFAGSVERLAHIFGDIQAQVSEQLVRERTGGAVVDPLTGLPGSAELHEWMRILLAEQRRNKHPFAVLAFDVDGLGRINEAFGRDAGDRLLRAVAAVLVRQLRPGDRAFRLADDEFCALAPQLGAAEAAPMAERLCRLVNHSLGGESPRLTISAGVASAPADGDEVEALLEAADEAGWAAKAAGRDVAIA